MWCLIQEYNTSALAPRVAPHPQLRVQHPSVDRSPRTLFASLMEVSTTADASRLTRVSPVEVDLAMAASMAMEAAIAKPVEVALRTLGNTDMPVTIATTAAAG
ncbi:hypothetical protein [Thalassoroseus pseudoceratinae]|uniref:hypothetical protein n=1 Tax=Thalassoroseus pseudoceratinae TaxID=2713176 RepID=UPI001423EF4D|nr:hypothetical protein [Thalassoroseus pseudoceratinae]